MRAKMNVPDAVSFATVANSCRNVALWEATVAIMEDMRSHAVCPDEFNFAAAVQACGDAQEWQHALHLVSISGLSLAAEAGSLYNLALHACGDATAWRQTLSIFELMSQFHMQPSSSALDAVVKANHEQLCSSAVLDAAIYRRGIDMGFITWDAQAVNPTFSRKLAVVSRSTRSSGLQNVGTDPNHKPATKSFCGSNRRSVTTSTLKTRENLPSNAPCSCEFLFLVLHVGMCGTCHIVFIVKYCFSWALTEILELPPPEGIRSELALD
eukprot:1329334-Amphidinium_carterae.1